MKRAIDELRSSILATTKDTRRKVSFALAMELEYCTLETPNVPDEIFTLYTEIFSSSVLCEKSGTDGFVFGLFNDFYKLSGEQRRSLLELFILNASQCADSTLRLAIGDLIARKYPLRDALRAFHRMWISGEKNSRTIAQFGVDVLSLMLPKEGLERDELRKFGLEMMRREK
ncbi:hypothetical protein M6G53_20370 [Serratia nevei]|uniref:hypothetical protein n=1 Tax=Serratia nevei TaxID=2703794 RepID=UPI0020A1C4F1|nr:hypothetical protein [Serratia nevei]MCP1107729.1 hypothetical protein [Serratia nevei]